MTVAVLTVLIGLLFFVETGKNFDTSESSAHVVGRLAAAFLLGLVVALLVQQYALSADVAVEWPQPHM